MARGARPGAAPSETAPPEPARRRRLPAVARRREIVAHAFAALAADGFEGLRLRDVAAAIGINSATLHHYFPTKQDLVEAVAEHLGAEFAAVRAPAVPEAPGVPEALRRLRQEFADARYCLEARPDLLAAFRELALRATRDPAVAALVAPLHAAWRASVADALREGQHAGVFRSSLEPGAAAVAVVAALWGMGTLLGLDAGAFAAGCDALEAALRK